MGQIALMAGIVATLNFFSIGVAIAVIFAWFGVPFDVLVTFGGALTRYAGMATWWLIFLAPALVYSALVFPWDETLGFPPAGQRQGNAS